MAKYYRSELVGTFGNPIDENPHRCGDGGRLPGKIRTIIKRIDKIKPQCYSKEKIFWEENQL